MIMFTQPCFIRKYSKDLCKMLENIGLKLMNPSETTLDCHNYDGKGNHRSIEEGRAIITYQSNHYGVIYDIDDVTKRGRIDCGTNKDLFIAIASLRDDTDKNQLFASNYFNINMKPERFVLCTTDDYKDFFGDCPYTKNYDDYHKATVEELIEHFK